jgi:two-component system, chemotaxis family, sensor kinase CheA
LARIAWPTASALLYLNEHTPLQDVQLLTECVPPLEQMEPEACHLALGARIPAGDTARIQEAFEFFLEGSLIITVRDSEPAQAVHAALQPLRERLGDEAMMAWRETGLILDEEWDGAAATNAPTAAAAERQTTAATAAPVLAAAPAASGAAAAGPAVQAPARFVRVPADRLDELMVQVGELVIASAGIEVLARESAETRLQEAVSSLMQLVDVIQSGTLKLRMVPIGETFSRFQRVVRDVSRDLGKRINLEVTGADTEMDKSMVERIGDPLMHLVRNAMDHGLETPEERLAAGKDEVGTVCLQAYHDSGNVIIEVSDDGRGLNRDRILNKAIERGLVANGDGLSDNDVFQLIFQPGFSTAEQVTSLSGRGVGMDVVKRTIEALRGTITLRSWEGFGSQVQMRLPLTLAIIDGFMVGVGQARFILPLDQVLECIELPKGALEQGQPDYIDLRGEVLPYTSLRQFFDLEPQAEGLRRPSVVVVRSGGHKTGILVDTLHGEIQTVIKPMTGIFRHLRGISGTAILGSGDIALILDVMQLVEHGIERARNASPVPMGTSL